MKRVCPYEFRLTDEDWDAFAKWLRECCGMDIAKMSPEDIIHSWDIWQDELFEAANPGISAKDLFPINN